MEAKIEFVHALAIGFNARSVDSLESEATVEPLVICVCVGGMALTSALKSTIRRLPELRS